MPAIKKKLRAEIWLSARHQGVNDIFFLKSSTVSLFSDCQKHEDISVKKLLEDEQMKILQLLILHFLSISHDLRLHNCMILSYLLSSLSLWAVLALMKYQYHLLYQPLFLSFLYVFYCFTSISPITVFLRDLIGNKVTQLFCVIPAIALHGEVIFLWLQLDSNPEPLIS